MNAINTFCRMTVFNLVIHQSGVDYISYNESDLDFIIQNNVLFL